MTENLFEAGTAVAPDIVAALDGVCDDARDDLGTSVEIQSARGFPAIEGLPLEKNQAGKFVWREISDASVVATDLKASTAVSYSKQDRVGARLYQASTGNCAKVMKPFTPDFVDIQGDGLFAIFAGEHHVERAMCAAVSLNSFGRRLAVMLADQFGDEVPEMKESGLKIGVDRGLMLVKRIGVRGDYNEPVWAGKPVNYATKCAQAAGAGQVIVTSRFSKEFRDNEFVRFSCGCVAGEPGGEVGPLWRKIEVDALGQDAQARELLSAWCRHCGTMFCRAILRGEKERDGLNTGPIKKWREDPPDEGEEELSGVAA